MDMDEAALFTTETAVPTGNATEELGGIVMFPLDRYWCVLASVSARVLSPLTATWGMPPEDEMPDRSTVRSPALRDAVRTPVPASSDSAVIVYP